MSRWSLMTLVNSTSLEWMEVLDSESFNLAEGGGEMQEAVRRGVEDRMI